MEQQQYPQRAKTFADLIIGTDYLIQLEAQGVIQRVRVLHTTQNAMQVRLYVAGNRYGKLYDDIWKNKTDVIAVIVDTIPNIIEDEK